jgi:hypothetical protein
LVSAVEKPISFLGADPVATAETLEALAADLRKLAKGRHPSPQMLAEAPLLRGWGFSRRPAACLQGRIYGHPVIGDTEFATTSELFAIDGERRWVRTMSRYYALGPAGMFGGEDG